MYFGRRDGKLAFEIDGHDWVWIVWALFMVGLVFGVVK